MLEFFYTLIIFPLETFLGLIYGIFLKMYEIHGIAIVLLSVSVNIILLPLYNMAEKWQQKERDIQKRLKPKLDDIKAVFKGSERHMIISTYYRQNNYHPVYSLRNVIGLAIQVPFFIAAYHLLSHMPMTDASSSYYFLSDLRLEDQLIKNGSLSFNFLPVLMTAVNLVSAFVYSGKLDMKEKRQLVIMAFLFLVLLYKSPAGLVLYWTLNNVFSLLKNILYTMKNPGRKFFYILIGFLGFLFLYSFLLKYQFFMKIADLGDFNFKNAKIFKIKTVSGFIFSLVFIIPFVFKYLNKFTDTLFTGEPARRNLNLIFFISCSVLFILTGLLIPSLLIAASPLEFTERISGVFYNPSLSIYHSGLQAFSFFVFIPAVVYLLFSDRVKKYLALTALILAVCALLNMFVFPGSYSVINPDFSFDNAKILNSETAASFLNMFSIVSAVLIALLLIKKKYFKPLINILLIVSLSVSSVFIYNISTINRDFDILLKTEQYSVEDANDRGIHPVFSINNTGGKNVVVIMLDRALGGLTGEIFKHNPEFLERMSGFRWYPNTVSFNGHTLLGAPPLFGGYDYSPMNMNKRDDVSLEEKHNESLLMMPRIFLENGYNVVTTDPRTDYSSKVSGSGLFDDYPEIRTENLIGKYSDLWISENIGKSAHSSGMNNILKEYLLTFSLFRISPNFTRSIIYDKGRWLKPLKTGLPTRFINSYSVLDYLPELTAFDSKKNTFSMMVNDSVHEPRILDIYAKDSFKNTSENNYKFPYKRKYTQIHFYTQIGAFNKLCEWFEYLKENNAYDNTKIIIVSDHGRDIDDPFFADFSDDEKVRNKYTFYHPLLLVKDFNSSGKLETSFDFMTNADTPSFALSHIKDAENPFTGNLIHGEFKSSGVDIVTIHSWKANRKMKNKFSYTEDDIIHVHDDISKPENWKTGNSKNSKIK